jgi:hypothetical protein
MARGSSYGGQPKETPLVVTPPSNVPRRATRVLQLSPVQVREERGLQVARPNLPLARNVSTPVPRPVLGFSRFAERRQALLLRHTWLPRLLVSLSIVVLGAIVLTTAGVYFRQPSSPYINYNGQSFPIQLGGSYNAYNLWENSNGPIAARTPIPKNTGPYSVLGKPTITAALINRVLSAYHSPAAGLGQDLYNLGVQYGIDPVYPLAFFMHESLFGTTGEARVTLSLGNERCIPDRPCIDQDRGGYAQMDSWQDGFLQWYKNIRNLYVAQWGLVTVDQIIPRYAPNSDGNDEAEYIASLKHEVDTWRAGALMP